MGIKTLFLGLTLIFSSSIWAATSPNGFTLNAASGSTDAITLTNKGPGNAVLVGGDVKQIGSSVPLYAGAVDLTSQITGLVSGGANTFHIASSVWDNWESIFIGLKQADGKKNGIGGYAIFELTREVFSGTWSTPSGQSGTDLSHYFAFGGELKPPSCLVPHLTGIPYYQLKKEKRWDKYYTEQPRPRTLSEQKYKRLKRAFAS